MKRKEMISMDYIKEIRKRLGHDPIILCACGCLIFNEKGQVLLQKRRDNGLWGNPGGCMELGETIYETAIREIREETNLTVSNLELFHIYSGENQHYIYPNMDEVYFVNIIFKTTEYYGELKSDRESLELKFFDLDDLPTDITKPFEVVKKDLEKSHF